jgi:hypothetical protein
MAITSSISDGDNFGSSCIYDEVISYNDFTNWSVDMLPVLSGMLVLDQNLWFLLLPSSDLLVPRIYRIHI